MWPFDPTDTRRPNLLDQMPRRVREHPRFGELVKRYLAEELGKWAAEGLAGREVWQMLEAADE